MFEIQPRLPFGHFHGEGCRLSFFSVPRMQRRLGFVVKPCLLGYFLCSTSAFHLWVPPRGYFFCHCSANRVISVRIPEGQMQLLLTAAAMPRRPFCFPGVLGTRRVGCPKTVRKTKFFLTSLSARALNFIPYDLLDLHVFVGSGGFSRCTVSWRQQEWSVDSYAHLLTRTSNTEWSKSAETMQKSMSGHWPKESLHQVYLCISLCWKKVFMMHSPLLHHSCNRSLPFSFTSPSLCRPITTSPKRIVDSLVLILRRA